MTLKEFSLSREHPASSATRDRVNGGDVLPEG